MRIVFVSHSPGTGGAEHSLVTLLSAAIDRGHDVILSLPYADPQAIREILPESRRLTIVSHRWVRMMQGSRPRLSGPLRVGVGYLDAHRFAVWLRAEEADVVVVNSTTIPQASLGAHISHRPAITMIREAIRTNPALPSFLPKRMIAWLIRRHSAATIAVSHYVSAQLGSATHVIYPEVPLGSLHPATVGTRTSLNVVMAGTLSREKGQWDAVDAVRIARSQGIDVRLSLYGQAAPDRLADLNAFIRESGLEQAIAHCGETRSMMDVFKSADVSMVCSRNEAFGRVTAESINAGTPVIGYDLGGTSEILRGGGGLLCEPNSAALASQLIALFRDADLLRRLEMDCYQLNQSGGVGGRASSVLDLIESVAKRARCE